MDNVLPVFSQKVLTLLTMGCILLPLSKSPTFAGHVCVHRPKLRASFDMAFAPFLKQQTRYPCWRAESRNFRKVRTEKTTATRSCIPALVFLFTPLPSLLAACLWVYNQRHSLLSLLHHTSTSYLPKDTAMVDQMLSLPKHTFRDSMSGKTVGLLRSQNAGYNWL